MSDSDGLWPDPGAGPPRPLSSREAAAYRRRSDDHDPRTNAPTGQLAVPALGGGADRQGPEDDSGDGPSTAAWLVGVLALVVCIGVGLIYVLASDGSSDVDAGSSESVTPTNRTNTDGDTITATTDPTTDPTTESSSTTPPNTLSGRISGDEIEVVGDVPSTQAAAALRLLLEQVAGVGSVNTDAVMVVAGTPEPTRIDVIIDAELAFPSGSDVLQDSFLPTLDRIAALMRANAGVTAVVEGHADAQGEPAINLSLSKRRADAVVAYLEGSGIEATRLVPLGKGSTEPLGDNATEEGRRQNRRIEFSIQGFRLDL